jgi:hypothetical protein
MTMDGKFKKPNELITRELALIRRTEIDADLAQMGEDPEYRAEMLWMESEFAVAQWEAFQFVEV